MGNQLYYQLHEAHLPDGCKSSTFVARPLWLDPVSPWLKPKCWFYTMLLHYDHKRRRSFSPKGVYVFPWRPGETAGSEYISTFPQNRMSKASLLFSFFFLIIL